MNRICLKPLLLFAALSFLTLTMLPEGSAARPGEFWRNASYGWTGYEGHPYTPVGAFTSVVFDDKIWVIGGLRDAQVYHNSVWYSSDGATWLQATASAAFPARSEHTSVVHDGRMWVMGGVGDAGLMGDVWYSVDGRTWLQSGAGVFPVRRNHTSVVFDGKMWVIGGDGNSGYKNDVWSSSDGVNWTCATASAAFPARSDHVSVVYDGKMWVIGGLGNAGPTDDVWHSSDGINWIQALDSADFLANRSMFAGVSYGGRIWILAGLFYEGEDAPSQQSDVWSSPDGITWTRVHENAPFPPTHNHASVVFHDNIWLIAGVCHGGLFRSTEEGNNWFSPDGLEWTHAANASVFPVQQNGIGLLHGGKIWTIGAINSGIHARSTVWTSLDGVKWLQATDDAAFPPRNSFAGASWGNKLWVVGGFFEGEMKNDVWSSTDGVLWERISEKAEFSPRALHSCVVYDGKLWVIGGQDAGGFRNDVWHSSDGVVWVRARAEAEFPPRGGHTSLVMNNRMWVIGGFGAEGALNDVWSSTNGITWSRAAGTGAFPGRGLHASAVHENKMWVIAGYGAEGVRNDVWYSTNGATWTQATAAAAFTGRAGHTCVAYLNRLWLMDESKREVWSSADGEAWRQEAGVAAFSARVGHTSLVFNEKIWMIGGGDLKQGREVWSSPDGTRWICETDDAAFRHRSLHASAVYNGRMWLIGGAEQRLIARDIHSVIMNDVWYSTNGAGWICATESAAFPPRRDHVCLVYHGRMWIIGGTDLSGARSDVWSSADGVNWIQETASADFGFWSGLGGLVFNDRMWIIVGSDVWYSTNGSVWTQATASAAFTPRSDHTCLAYDNAMWVIGGWSQGQDYRGDVWYSEDGVSWMRAAYAAAFPARSSHSSVVFDQQMFIIGGYGLEKNKDVWFSGTGCRVEAVPALLDFGPHPIGAGPCGSLSATLSNLYPESWEHLVIRGVSIENDDEGSFSFASEPDKRILLINDSRSFDILFDPGSLGPKSANLVIETEHPAMPVITVRLAGEGIEGVAAPSDPKVLSVTDHSIRWGWTDNANDEEAFHVYAGPGAAAPAIYSAILPADATYWDHDDLGPDSQYAFSVSAYNQTGESARTDVITTWTLAALPIAPLVDNPTTGTLRVGIGGGDGNPANTQYAVFCATAGQWVQADGTLGAVPAWQGVEDWAQTTVTGLLPGTYYAFRVVAVNGAGRVTYPGPETGRNTLTPFDVHGGRLLLSY